MNLKFCKIILTFAIPLLAALITIAGCSGKPERFGFSGTVTVNGSPVVEGNLRLTPQGDVEGSTRCAANIREGKFTFPADGGLSPGTYVVCINAVDRERSVIDDSSPAKSKIVELIPPEWNVKSTHTIEIVPGKNVFDFAITKE
ncbi:MAG: hypothetical protein Q4G68_10135 [Planctomycetia bacterium]|nr:hypothetical protein [Planctomycetia bacterium]